MTPQARFQAVIEQSVRCIANVQTDQFDLPTPCSEWTLEQLLNHMVYELLWVPDMLAGKTVADVGSRYDGDVLHGDVQTALTTASSAAIQAVNGITDLQQPVHVSYGDVTAQHYIDEMISEVVLHSWDVDQAIQCNLIIPDDTAQYIYEWLQPRQKEMAGSGLFAAQVEVPEGSSIQTKLLGLVGRQAA